MISKGMEKRFILAMLVIGFSGIVAQILLLRELLVSFFGNELSIGIILANWLILEAFGCFFLGGRLERFKRELEAFVCLLLLFSLFLPLSIYAARVLKVSIGVTAGEGIGLIPIAYSSFLILLPASVSHGALFTLGCKLHSLCSSASAESGKQEGAASISKVYIYETLGTIVGGIGFTYLLIPYFHSLQIALVVSLLNIILCIHLLMPEAQTRTAKILAGVSVIFLLLTVFLIFGGGANKIHRLSIKRQWPSLEVVHYENSRYGNIAVVQSGEQYTFFSDGLPIITTPIPDIIFVEEFSHFPLLSHPDPQEILVLSGGAGGVISEILKHPSVKRVDYAELDPLILELVRKFSTSLTEAELSDPRVSIKHIDSRLFVQRTAHRYDLILVGFTNPSDLRVNRLFTREFFFLAKKRLREEGILVIGLPSAPRADIHLRELANLNAAILNTLKDVYPHIKIIPGEGINLFLASASEGISLISSDILSRRLAERDISVNLLAPAYIEYRWQFWWQDNFLASIEGASERINQDFKPMGTFYSLSYWNALFSPYMREIFRWLEGLNLLFFFILLFAITLLFLAIRSKIARLANLSIPLCISATGFAGMTFDLALIFTFQALYGYVFHWLGLLVTTFMVGAATGAMIMTFLLARIKKDLASFIKIELAIVLFSLLLPLIFIFFHPYLYRPAVFVLGKIVFLILSFLSGLLVGLQFPLANKIYLGRSHDLSRTAGLLYGADLFGGWLGAIAGGVALLPVLGLFGACMVALMLKIVSLIILITSIRSLR